MVVTTASGLAAAFGGGLVLMWGTPSPAVLGHLLSFAAGIMLYISYGDLLPHAQAHLATAGPNGPGDDPSGFWGANTAMLGGMLFFAAVVWLVPEGEGVGNALQLEPMSSPSASEEPKPVGRDAAVSGGVARRGGLRRRKTKADADEDEPTSPADPQLSPSSASSPPQSASSSRLAMTGIVAALGISLHNLPEGLIVYNQSVTGLCTGLPPDTPVDPSQWSALLLSLGFPGGQLGGCFSRGLAVTLAVALHNIPEGMAVATPLYASTGSKWIAFKWCLLSSLCEPLAALIFGVFFSSYLTPYLIAMLNAGVAGIMICLCLIELIPTAVEHTSAKSAVLSNIAGQAVMFLSLHFMSAAGLH